MENLAIYAGGLLLAGVLILFWRYMGSVRCPVCRGRKHLASGTCPLCSGSGRVP